MTQINFSRMQSSINNASRSECTVYEVFYDERHAQKQSTHIKLILEFIKRCNVRLLCLLIIIYSFHVLFLTKPIELTLDFQNITGNISHGSSSDVSLQVKNQSGAAASTDQNVRLDQPDVVKYIKNPPLKELYDAGFDISNADLCPDSGASVKVLALIKSARQNGETRMAIRETYGQYALRRDDVSIGFTIGRPRTPDSEITTSIASEAGLYGDIILGRYVDTFYNLSLKTTSALEWTSTYCSKAKFLLRADDDVFLNIPRILDLVESWSNRTRTIIGYKCPYGPTRNPSDKHYSSPQEYSPHSFPPYAFGMAAYLIAGDIVRDLYTQGLMTPYFHSDDVFYTGCVGQAINAKKLYFDGSFKWFNDCRWEGSEKHSICNLKDNFKDNFSVRAEKSKHKFYLWNETLFRDVLHPFHETNVLKRDSP